MLLSSSVAPLICSVPFVGTRLEDNPGTFFDPGSNEMTLTHDAWMAATDARLLAARYRAVPPPAAAAPGTRMYRRGDFRLRWMATKLHTFIIITPGPSADAGNVSAFSALATQWAKDAKGGFPVGLQTGLLVLPVLLAGHATPDGHQRAIQSPPRDFGTMTFPVLVDLAAGTSSSFAPSAYWGGFFRNFIRAQQALLQQGTH